MGKACKFSILEILRNFEKFSWPSRGEKALWKDQIRKLLNCQKCSFYSSILHRTVYDPISSPQLEVLQSAWNQSPRTRVSFAMHGESWLVNSHLIGCLNRCLGQWIFSPHCTSTSMWRPTFCCSVTDGKLQLKHAPATNKKWHKQHQEPMGSWQH